MTNTKKVQLKLVSGSFRFFFTTLAEKIKNEGWDTTNHMQVTDNLFIATLEKYVDASSTIPTLSTCNCKPVPKPPAEAVPEAPVEPPIQFKEETKGVVATTEETQPEAPVEAPLGAITELTVESPTQTYELSAKGFQMRPYTLDELQLIEWSELVQLGFELGVSTGTKATRPQAIVEASELKWSNKI